LFKVFEWADNDPVGLRKVGFLGQPHNRLIATQSIDQEFVKPELNLFYSTSESEALVEAPHFACS